MKIEITSKKAKEFFNFIENMNVFVGHQNVPVKFLRIEKGKNYIEFNEINKIFIRKKKIKKENISSYMANILIILAIQGTTIINDKNEGIFEKFYNNIFMDFNTISKYVEENKKEDVFEKIYGNIFMNINTINKYLEENNLNSYMYYYFCVRYKILELKKELNQLNKNVIDNILETFLKNNNISLSYIKNVRDKIIEDITKQNINIKFLQNNIEDVFGLEKSYIDDMLLSDLFSRLKDIQKDCFYLKYYENQTLEQISKKYNVTRERIRQYIINAENKIFNLGFSFIKKLLLSIEQEIRIQQIITKENLYEQFKDYSNDKRDTISFINCFLKNKKYEQSDNFVLSNDVSIEKIKNFLEICSVEPVEEIYKKLEINFNLTSDTIEKVFKILNKFIFKKGYFINPTIPNKVLYLFYIEQRPIHISELENLYKREFETKNNMHNLHAHVQNLQEIVLCGRGIYILKTNVDSKILEDNEYLNKVINLLEDKNYELNVNIIKQETKTLYSISELILLLNSNDNFANLGRGYYGLKKWNYNNRKYIKDIIYKYMSENMRPVSIGELLIYLEKQGKILNEYSLNGLLIHNEDIFKKHSFKKWELREYPSISLNLDENKLNTIKNDTKEIHNLLSEIFIDEKENSINDKATNIDLQQENTNNIDDFIKIIIEKNTWTKQELINIMKDKSVMISSVIDEINEWSNEQYGDFLLEEENSIYILNEDVRNLIMNKN